MSARRSRCPHVSQIRITWAEINKKRLTQRACSSCGDTNSNQWLCLCHSCGYVGCGHRCHDHSSSHAKSRKHPIAINLHNRKIFCHSCNMEVIFGNNQPSFVIQEDTSSNDSLETKAPPHRHFSVHSGECRVPNGHMSSAHRTHHQDMNGGHPEGIDVHGAHHISPPRPPPQGGFSYAPYVPGTVGLRNFGNTCYMNASLQALLNCPQLNHVFLDGLTLQPSHGSKICLAPVFQNLLRDIWSPEPLYHGSRVVTPSMVSSAFRSFYPAFRGFVQQDAQEFLRLFIDRLHEELKQPVTMKALQLSGVVTVPLAVTLREPSPACRTETPSKDAISAINRTRSSRSSTEHPQTGDVRLRVRSHSHQTQSDVSACDEVSVTTTTCVGHKQVQPATALVMNDALHYSSIISDVFRGTFRNTCECLQCGYTSTVVEPFYDLSVPIAGTQGSSSAVPSSSSGSSATQLKGANRTASPPSDPGIRPNGSDSASSSTGADEVTAPTKSTPSSSSSSTSSGTKKQHRSAKQLRKTLLHRLGGRNRRRLERGSNSHATPNENSSWVQWILSSFKSWFVTPKTTLQDCLDAYFCDDDLVQDNQYYCERCRKLVDGTKRSELLHLPEILCIHLKRFRHDFSLSSKLTHQIVFPMFGLDMSPYMAVPSSLRTSDDVDTRFNEDGPENNTSFETDSGISVPSPASTLLTSSALNSQQDTSAVSAGHLLDLIAVICHLGSGGNFGHYTCYAVHHETQQWYEYDDERVQPVEVATVTSLLSQAYILFYKKSDEVMLPIRQTACHLEMAGGTDELLPMFIDREWILKFNSFSHPGPISNARLVCANHGALLPCLKGQESEHFLRVPTALWDYFRKNFGGGPAVSSLHVCTHCDKVEEQLKMRREKEYLTVYKGINEFRTRGNTSSAYAIDLKWFNTWQRFVEGHDARPPGPIDNSAICQRVSQALQQETRYPQPMLRLLDGADYGTMSGAVWHFLHETYGGGPMLCLYGSARNSTASSEDEELQEQRNENAPPCALESAL